MTVYSGTKGKVGDPEPADIMRPDWGTTSSAGSSSTEDVIISTNAGRENINLKVSWVHNYNWREEAFSKFDFSITPDKAEVSGFTTPWEYWENSDRYHSGYHISTLEGVQVSFDLGEDVNGWDFADIDWENS